MALEAVFTEEADAEFDDAAAWLRERNPRAAQRFVESFHDTVARICRHPGQFGWIDEEHRVAVIPKSRHLIIFNIEGDAAVIVAVMHGSREPGYWRGRGE